MRGSLSANICAFNVSFEMRLCNTGMVYLLDIEMSKTNGRHHIVKGLNLHPYISRYIFYSNLSYDLTINANLAAGFG
ncbi:Uncharacterised protein [Raoultella terrigena]|uniref:Uncharacterized protein n=1 Tax=Raoultella terrigena TaxID=577 RepID=A0A3P8KZB4_RAOTE|nr:Uncharacterised protein [Raoultella terrigena]